jgi:hypothetical protein
MQTNDTSLRVVISYLKCELMTANFLTFGPTFEENKFKTLTPGSRQASQQRTLRVLFQSGPGKLSKHFFGAVLLQWSLL